MLPSEGVAFFDIYGFSRPLGYAIVLFVFLLTIPLKIVIGRLFSQDFGK